MGKSGDGQGRQQRRSAGQCRDRMAGVLRGAHEFVTWIGNERRAGVRHQCDGGAVGEPAQQHRPRFAGIVLVIGRERGRDGVAVEQFAGDAGVLAGDQVGAGKRFQGAQRDVAEIANRGGNDMQPRGKLRHVDLPTAKEIASPCVNLRALWNSKRVAHRRHISLAPGGRHVSVPGRVEFLILFI